MRHNSLGLFSILAAGLGGFDSYNEIKFNLRKDNNQEALDSANRKIKEAQERNRDKKQKRLNRV